jgi:hypothetical protein
VFTFFALATITKFGSDDSILYGKNCKKQPIHLCAHGPKLVAKLTFRL